MDLQPRLSVYPSFSANWYLRLNTLSSLASSGLTTLLFSLLRHYHSALQPTPVLPLCSLAHSGLTTLLPILLRSYHSAPCPPPVLPLCSLAPSGLLGPLLSPLFFRFSSFFSIDQLLSASCFFLCLLLKNYKKKSSERPLKKRFQRWKSDWNKKVGKRKKIIKLIIFQYTYHVFSS